MPNFDVAADPPTILAADIVLDVRTGGAGAVYTYTVPAGTAEGDAFFVPLGNRTVLGFVFRVFEADESALGYPIEKLKEAGPRVEGASLPASLVQLVRFVADEYLCPLPVALSAATPPGILDRVCTTWTLVPGRPAADALTPLQAEVLQTIESQGGKLVQGAKAKFETSTLKALRLLKAKGLVHDEVGIDEQPGKRDAQPLYRLTHDAEFVDRFLKDFAKKRPAQALTILRLREIEESALTSGDIKGLCGVTESTVRQLVEAKILERVSDEAGSVAKAPIPSAHQQIAIDAISEAVMAREAKPFLLFGVTGSGKTEVYLRAAGEAVRVGRQVLYLVPEIALATQAVRLLRERFGKSVAIIHSDLSPSDRLENWLGIRSEKCAVVLGARSAAFAPLGNLGLIIVDEEHEASYKQESSPRYHAKQAARFLSELHRCPVVFGSATPSLESFYEAEQDQLTLLSLPQRAASAQLPTVHVEDLSEGYRENQPSIFTEALRERIEQCLERREQAILFLNRRAYAPFLICRDCGHPFVCPNCSVSLTYSRRAGRLRCHHCGHGERPPETCPSCRGTRLKPFGIGTEKVEEAVAELFPEARVARLDRDVSQRKGALESTLALFGSGEIDILVGTQMVAKGLNFPGVTLVGVIAADLSLNIPDFRASERTYQLLSQVAGRAGRGQKPGDVVIQTFNPRHVAVEATESHNYHQVYEALLEERREAGYPPFTRLANFLFTGADLAAVRDFASETAAELRPLEAVGVHLLGPTECAIERLANQWRMHLLLKLPPGFPMAELAARIPPVQRKGAAMAVDVDPYSVL